MLLATAPWLPAFAGAHADMQVPMLPGMLRDDERDAVIDLLERRGSGNSRVAPEELDALERDARVELWVRTVLAAWITDEAAG